MDILFWIQANPRLTIDHTPKKYFGKYLYKMVVYAPGGRLIDAKPSVPIEQSFEHRRERLKMYGQSGYWGYKNNKDFESADIGFLNLLRDLRHDRSLNIRLRVEEPMIQIYADQEQSLIDLVKSRFGVTYSRYVESISGPANSEAEKLLNSGAIIKKTDLGYKYKIILRDGRYGPEVKKHLFDYITQLGPNVVRVPKSSLEMLEKSTGYIWNFYLYSNDQSLVSFLNIIYPGIVSNIHELVTLTNK